MKLAIMQPYFFPYIGYFQLIYSVDKIVFYDDVNFIKNGWINRNRILIQNEPGYFTVHLKKASPHKTINQIEFIDNRQKLLKTIRMAYSKAPFFCDVFPVIEKCLNLKTNLISELAVNSNKEVCSYLEIKTIFERSSSTYPDTKPMDKTKRIISICNRNEANTYVNAIGGKEIYAKEDFSNSGIELFFIKPHDVAYKQFSNEFIPWLSIIDVMMFNSVGDIRKMLNNYELV